MHTTYVTLKDGRKLSGVLWTWRPRLGWMELTGEEMVRVYFADVLTAVTPGERTGVRADGMPIIEAQDELERARRWGWDGGDPRPSCKFCAGRTDAGESHLHDGTWVCVACWDERLKTTE